MTTPVINIYHYVSTASGETSLHLKIEEIKRQVHFAYKVNIRNAEEFITVFYCNVVCQCRPHKERTTYGGF